MLHWSEERPVGSNRRGVTATDAGRRLEIARKGGRAAHEKGTAHEWTAEETQKAGRKGGAGNGEGEGTATND